MKIFIDANSDWNGGYLSHLKGFLSSKSVSQSKNEFFIYGPSKLKNILKPFHDNINYQVDDSLPSGFYKMHNWRRFHLPKIIRRFNPDVHFNPMGWMASNHKLCPQVTMSRNLQPFLSTELNRFSFFSEKKWRLILSKRMMVSSYCRSNGLIFLSEYAKEIISPLIDPNVKYCVIPHGVNDYFRVNDVRSKSTLTQNQSVTLLYVSRVFTYKNHDNVILAVNSLREKLHINIKLVLIGGVSTTASYLIDQVLKKIEDSSWIQFVDALPNDEIVKWYHSSDVFLFASSVENFPNILLEAMASGLSIACSNRRPMKDILLDGGEYFEPDNPESIAISIEKLILNEKYRRNLAIKAHLISQNYSYEKMSADTVNFLETFY